MGSTRKNTLCLKQKLELIDSFENQKVPVKELQRKYKCGKTQIYGIIRQKDELRKMWEQGARADLRKKRKTDNEEINNFVWEWFVNAKSQNLPVSGPLLQYQAKAIAEKLGNITFKASNGWLDSFRKRHNIIGNQVCEEVNYISQECIDEWKNKVPLMIAEYKVEDVFSGCETGLFFRALPNETASIKEEKSNSARQSRERLTIFLCCSLKGEKEKPLVIGKSAKPRCFENLCLSKLPVIWKSSKNAWMTSEIMEEWLKSFDKTMEMQQRNVLLFMSSVACNPGICLKNVKLVLLPKNSASQTQALNQGIIENLKIHYRKLCIQSIVTRMSTYDNTNEMSKSITLLDAVLWISSSWNSVKENVIEISFKKAGFPSDSNDTDTTIEEDIRTINQIISESFPDTCNAEQYLDIDRNISTAEPIGSIDDVKNHNHLSDNSDLDEEVEAVSMVDEQNQTETYTEVLNSINFIRDFSLAMNDGYLFNLMNSALAHVENGMSFGVISKQEYALPE